MLSKPFPVEGNTTQSLMSIVERADAVLRGFAAPSFVAVMLRVALAIPFWKSGILKWDGFLRLNDVAVELFSSEFKLHLPGGPYPFAAPATVAFVTGCAEILLPVLLVLGLATRFCAAGLLVMTCVVELTVPNGWPIHITWAAMALAVMALGPGVLSSDHLIRRALQSARSVPESHQLRGS